MDNSTTPTILNVPFSQSVKGPLPRVDVTAYGADPTGVTDSTAAITTAAAAACTAGSTLNFPPGAYTVTQTQLPSTSSVIPIPCAHLHITASGDQGTAQSEQPPQAKIVVANVGSNPNAAPVFAFKYPTNTGSITIDNLQISGYNQALSFYATPNITLKNVCLTAQSTGLADNVPLKVTNVSSFRMTAGCLNSGSASLPMALFTGEAPAGSEVSVVEFVQIEHVRGSGGNFQYVQRVDAAGAVPGNFVFDDVTPVASTTDFLTVTNTTGHLGQAAMPQFGPVFILNSSLPASTSSEAIVNFNSSGSDLTGVHIYNSSGVGLPEASETTAPTAPGACSIETQGGLDFVADSTTRTTARRRQLRGSTIPT